MHFLNIFQFLICVLWKLNLGNGNVYRIRGSFLVGTRAKRIFNCLINMTIQA